MKKKIMQVLVVLSATLATGLVMVAQSDADYQGYMKTVAATNGKMQKGIAAKEASAAADASTLETVFKQVEAFWGKRNAADAVALAKQAHMAAAAAGKAINAGNWEQAAAEGKNVGGTCQGCHAAHRGGEKGAFTIK
jgi:hypothetical protein